MAIVAEGLSVGYVNAHQILGLGAAVPAVGCIIVAARFYVRKMQKTAVSIDDWLILGALVLLVGMGACVITAHEKVPRAEKQLGEAIGAKTGVMGYPTPPLPSLSPTEMDSYVQPEVIKIQQIGYPFQLLMVGCYCLVKLSIIFFCRRLFVVGGIGTFNYITILAAVVVGLWTLIFLGFFAFQCGTNFAANWGSIADINASCIHPWTTEEAMAASDLILDGLIFFLPFPVIWKLRINTIRKIAVSLVFTVGAMSIAAGAVRLVVYIEILHKTENGTLIDEDLGITLMHFWALLEAGLALIAACMPSLSIIFAKKSLKSAIDNVRKVFSLSSMRSHDTDRSRSMDTVKVIKQSYRMMQHNDNSSSQAYLTTKNNIRFESVALGDLEAGRAGDFVEGSRIRVENVLSQKPSLKGHV